MNRYCSIFNHSEPTITILKISGYKEQGDYTLKPLDYIITKMRAYSVPSKELTRACTEWYNKMLKLRS